jgi:hypothetical protein
MGGEQPDAANLETDLADAIAAVLANHETSMVTKWVALIEVIDSDCERGLWTATSSDAKAWDTIGLLQHAVDIQRAQTTADVLNRQHPDN